MGSAKFWTGICVGAIATPLVGWGVAATGFINMSASGPVGPLDELGEMMFERNVERLAPDRKNPFRDDRQALASGFEHYKSSCVQCHGAPDIAGADWTRGMQPTPPSLDEIAAFVRTLGSLTDEQKSELRQRVAQTEHSHGEGHSEQSGDGSASHEHDDGHGDNQH